LFGELVSAQADEHVFAPGRWPIREDHAARRTPHHLGGGVFAAPSRTLRA
jgi:hypothetical protein